MTRERFIIIRGGPGSGKTSTAKELAKHFPEGVTIEVDHIRRSMNAIIWHNHQQHFDAIHVMAATARAYAERGYSPVVIVDTLGFGSLEMALEALAPDSVRVYSLVCDPWQLVLRLCRRRHGFRDIRKARRFNTHILSVAAGQPELINTTYSSPHEVCRRIVELELGVGANASPAQNSLR